MLPFNSMSGEVAAKVVPIATLHAVDRKGRTIDLTPAYPLRHRLLREWNPERIELFGSRARGDANPAATGTSCCSGKPWSWSSRWCQPIPSCPGACGGTRASVPTSSSTPRIKFEAECDVPNTLAYEAASAAVTLYER
jgi:hypothetical protein